MLEFFHDDDAQAPATLFAGHTVVLVRAPAQDRAAAYLL